MSGQVPVRRIPLPIVFALAVDVLVVTSLLADLASLDLGSQRLDGWRLGWAIAFAVSCVGMVAVAAGLVLRREWARKGHAVAAGLLLIGLLPLGWGDLAGNFWAGTLRAVLALGLLAAVLAKASKEWMARPLEGLDGSAGNPASL